MELLESNSLGFFVELEVNELGTLVNWQSQLLVDLVAILLHWPLEVLEQNAQGKNLPIGVIRSWNIWVLEEGQLPELEQLCDLFKVLTSGDRVGLVFVDLLDDLLDLQNVDVLLLAERVHDLLDLNVLVLVVKESV